MEGVFSFDGTAQFKEHVTGTEGIVNIYVDGYHYGTKTFEGTDITWNYTEFSNGEPLDAGAFSQGDHLIEVSAKANNGAWSEVATGTFTIDNTPTVTVSSPGPVEGAFSFDGTAQFKEHVNGLEGQIRIYVDSYHYGSKNFEGTDITWNYTEFSNGELLDAGRYNQGDHLIQVVATANNGMESEIAAGTFTIDNTPTVTVNSPGLVEGAFSFDGTAQFKEHVNGTEGTVYIYVDGYHYGTKTFEGTSITWNYTDFSGGTMLNAISFSKGEHTIEVNAIAHNGAASEIATGTFIISELDDPKNRGNGCPTESKPIAGNPINFSIGNKYQKETDFVFERHGIPFAYRRYYNSRSEVQDGLGVGWTGSYSEHLRFETGKIILHEADGEEVHFIDNDQGQYISEADKVRVIEPIANGYQLLEPDGKVLTFDSFGKLTQIVERNGNSQTIGYSDNKLSYVEDNSGRRIDFTYNADGRLSILTTPIGLFSYSYDIQGNLSNITNPGLFQRTYLYDDPNDPNNLTGIINERGIRSGTYAYDDQDRAIRSEGADGQKRIDVSYDNNFVRHITNSKGFTTDNTLHVEYGIGRIKSSTSEGCSSCSGSTVLDYDLDDRLWINSSTDANGTVAAYTYDNRGNILTKREAAGTPIEKLTTYTYHPSYDLVASITKESVSSPEQTAITSFSYDTAGNLLQKTETGFSGSTPFSLTTTYTYNSSGQITSIDGPRTDNDDITILEYYANDPAQGLNRGMLRKIINSLGHETVFSQYNSFGKPEQSVDANGVVTTQNYDSLGRLTSKTTAGITTTSEYDAVSNLKAVSLPEGRTISYTYTGSDLLERVEDNLGNYIIYVYDTEGNRIREEIHDSGGTLRKFMDFEFDSFNRLSKTIYPGNVSDDRNYDLNGNIINLTDANNNPTTYAYDELNRLVSVTQPGNVTTGYSYDGHNNLVTVTDAENHTTTYTYDDAGRMISTTSPDTGITTYAYDAAGNLIAKTDAEGNTITYTYDALNRITGIHFSDSSQDITYSYDQGTDVKGRLTGMTDPSGTYAYTYDTQGNLIKEEKTIGGVTYETEYTYDSAGVLTGITYPNGRTVNYQLDNAGRVVQVSTAKDGTTHTVAQNIDYLPFGPMSSLTYGNGTVLSQAFDQLYRPERIVSDAILDFSYTADAVGNITTIADNLDDTKNRTFKYDDLNRLSQATGLFGTIDYTYDKVGNRLNRTTDGETDTYAYESGKNRLSEITGVNPQSFTYDTNGNTTAFGDKTLTYNQNDRLIKVTENSTVKGEYTYNGNGQRVKKVSGGETVIYHYDRFGNLLGESTVDGTFTREYIYLNSMRLAAFASATTHNEVTVAVTTDDGRDLFGLKVYAFTEAGSYTGKYAVTDEFGKAEFAISEFSDGNYKFRADYLSNQFWSEVVTIPGTYSLDIEIEEETTTLAVFRGDEAQSGVKVYLFNANGSYLGLYEITDENGEVSFDLPVGMGFKFRADTLGSQYFSDIVEIVSGETNTFVIDMEGGLITLTIDKGDSTPLTGVNAYLFKESGSYLGLWDQTDDQGMVDFDVSSGQYKIRVDYLGYLFWTDIIDTDVLLTAVLSLPHHDVTITVVGDHNGDIQDRENINTYLFTPQGAYLGIYEVTDEQGQVVFNLPEKEYNVRSDYMSQQFWSEVFNTSDETITIEEGMAEVTVSSSGTPIEGINIYSFNSNGSYLGLYETSDAEGNTLFRLPQGDYNFRADYMGNQYWSGVTTIISHIDNLIPISTGGGAFTATILKGPEEPLVGVKCYLYNESGTYLGKYGTTNDSGEVSYDISDGSYKIRIDYLGYQFWTAVFNIPGAMSITHIIPHHDNTILVARDYNGDIQPGGNLNVYLFTPSGSYLDKYDVTDDQGQAIFNLPEKAYKVRADYLSHQFWSEEFISTDTVITIEEGMAEVKVMQGTSPLSNVIVYAYNESGSYLDLNEATDTEGKAYFCLPTATYKFRADHQGTQFWATETILSHQVNSIQLTTGGGTFVLTVEKETCATMTGIKVYVFSTAGSYLGINSQTDEQGKVSFDLSDGSYMFRVDYLGNQFWTEVCAVPDTMSDAFSIPHQDVTVTVNRVYGSVIEPIENIKAYLFTAYGSYMGKYANTDSEGQVVFNLPEEDYKVRADYIGSQYWSDAIYWQDEDIDIDHGIVNIHVTNIGEDIENAKIYLFTETGSYLGKYENTDSSGSASFTLPVKLYKFRVDYGGSQYWSEEITPLPHGELYIDLALDLLALNLTNNPKPVRFDGVPLEFQSDGIMLASIGSLTGILTQSIVVQIPEPKIYYYINDHLGTPMKVIDENNTIAWSADYTPFGEAEITVDTFKNNFRFPGQYYDQESDLHYNYHRYYQPEIGRYLRADPIGIQKDNLNLYLYANNNSLKYFDSNGLIVLAMCSYTSGGDIIGGGGIECELTESECVAGYREKAKYTGFFGGITAGSPAGKTSFSLLFEKVDDVRSLKGRAKITSISATLCIGASWGEICLGNDCSRGWSAVRGVDLSADLFVGYGFVTDIEEECCDN